MVCNETNYKGALDWNFDCVPFNIKVLFGIISGLLFLLLCWNIIYCVSKCCSGKRACRPKTKLSQSPRTMEDNPIYGNLSYTETSMNLVTEDDPQHLSVSSSSLRDQRVDTDSQFKTQDCYANVTLKPPRTQGVRSSPQIAYSDVAYLEEPLAPAEEDEGNTNAASNVSELYASVKTQHTKIVNTADDGEAYANHL